MSSNDNGIVYETLIEACTDEKFAADMNRALNIITSQFTQHNIPTGVGIAAMFLQAYKTIEAAGEGQCKCGECVTANFFTAAQHAVDVIEAGLLHDIPKKGKMH